MRASELELATEGFQGHGSLSVWCGPTGGDAWFAAEPDAAHYAASTMKLALVMAAFRDSDAGALDLNTTVPIHNQHRSSTGRGTYAVTESEDSDPEVWRRLGESVSLRWLAYRAIVRSSNLATNLLIEAVGVPAVQRLLSDIGCNDSSVMRGIEDTDARDAGLQNVVTASDLAGQLQALVGESILTPTASREVLDVLAAQQINDALPRGLPSGVRVAHKSGWVEGVSHDAGVVYPAGSEPFVLVVCTTTNLDHDSATSLISHIAAAAWKDVCRAP